MSAVYRAIDPNLNRQVAIKLIHPHLSDNPNFIDRFKEEATAIARLRHPNIVQVYDFNNDGDTYYMVMEFLAGETLQARLRRINAAGRLLPFDEVIRYSLQICDAAGYAHKRELIHRDIKPANIMLDLHNQVILMDFGIVKIVGGQYHTVTGATIGTATYMSPEQVRSERVDERSDIYSIGVTLFEMLTGKPPYEADSALTLMMMHLNDPIPDLQELRLGTPAELAAIAKKALAKEPHQRFQAASELAEALRQVPLAAPVENAEVPTEIAPPPTAAAPSLTEASPDSQALPQPVADSGPTEGVVAAEPAVPEAATLPLEEGEADSKTITAARTDVEPPMESPPPEPPKEQVAAVPPPQAVATAGRRRLPRWLLPVVGLSLLAIVSVAAIWLINQRRPPELQLTPIEQPLNPINLDTQPRLVSLGQWRVDSVNDELAYSPDSTLLGAASNRDWVRYSPYRFYGSLWQVNSGQVKAQLLDHTAWLNSVDFSADGTLFTTAGEDARINIWQVSDGSLLRTIESNIGGITNVDFSPGGLVLAAATWDGKAGIWQLSNGNLLRTQSGDENSLRDVAFSPDGKLLAASSESGAILIWQMSDGALLRTLKGHTAKVHRIDFSPDGTLIASASEDQNVGLWQVSDGQLLATLVGHDEGVSDVAFSADGSLLASCSGDGTLRLWRVSDGLLLRTIETGESVLSVIFSPDRTLLVASGGDHSVWFWGVSEAIPLGSLP
jgi:serine/threonine protein kinase